MEYYVTTDTMVGSGVLDSLLQSSTKKERTLCVFHNKDSVLSFQGVKTLVDAAKKISFEFIETKSDDDLVFSLGFLAGTLKSRGPVYTIFPPSISLSDTVRSMYHLEEYKPAAPTAKKRNRPAAQKPQKEEPDAEQSATAPEPVSRDKEADSQDEESASGQEPPEDTFMNPPEAEQTKEAPSPVQEKTDPLFFSDDAEKFFAKQLGNEKHYRTVALCMKDSTENKTRAEELIRNRVSLTGAAMEKVVNTVRQKWDILYGCLFIRRR